MTRLIYAGVAIAAAAVGFIGYRLFLEPRITPAATAPSAQPELNTAREGVPANLPEFTLPDLKGEPRSIQSWPGKSMIVNFWATWCAPCRREIPLLQEMQKRHAAEGFQLVGVAVDFREDVVKYAQEIGIDYPVLIGEQAGLDAVGKFGQGSLGFPFTVFTDNQHRIVALHVGELEQAEVDILLDAVRQVNRGELSPDAARMAAARQLASLPQAAN